MGVTYGKVAKVITTPDDYEKGITVADVLCDIKNDEDVIRFPCAKEKIGGIYFKKTTKKRGKQKIEIISVSFTEYLEEIKKMGCKKIMFEDGRTMEV